MSSTKLESCSQFGEDLFILNYFEMKKGLVFVEVGAFLPDALSNTYLLEQNGWDGVLIEPQPELCEKLLRQRRAKVFQFACGSPAQHGKELLFEINGALSKIVNGPAPGILGDQNIVRVSVRTLDSILTEAEVDKVDFLSIDTEGAEMDVLKGFTVSRWHPSLVIIEDNDGDLAPYRFLKNNGYKLVNRTGCNNWYVPNKAKHSISYFKLLKLKARVLRSKFFRAW